MDTTDKIEKAAEEIKRVNDAIDSLKAQIARAEKYSHYTNVVLFLAERRAHEKILDIMRFYLKKQME
jgi:hypothetical protein